MIWCLRSVKPVYNDGRLVFWNKTAFDETLWLSNIHNSAMLRFPTNATMFINYKCALWKWKYENNLFQGHALELARLWSDYGPESWHYRVSEPIKFSLPTITGNFRKQSLGLRVHWQKHRIHNEIGIRSAEVNWFLMEIIELYAIEWMERDRDEWKYEEMLWFIIWCSSYIFCE